MGIRSFIIRRVSSQKLLIKWSNSEECHVRIAVADNPNTHVELLEKLAEDKDSIVRSTAKYNLEVRNSKM